MNYVPPFLAPLPAPAPLEGNALQDFVQAWIVGITGLDGTLVRPTDQSEQPNIPEAAVPWCAFGLSVRPSDTFAYTVQLDDGTHLQRHEQLALLCSFYDTGSGATADRLASRMRDGVSIAQNREYLLDQSFAVRSTGDLTPAPVLINTRWQYRVDLPIELTRVIELIYPVDSVAGGLVELYTGDGLVRTFPIDKEN